LFLVGITRRHAWVPRSGLYRWIAGAVAMGLVLSQLVYLSVYAYALLLASEERVAAVTAARQDDPAPEYRGSAREWVLVNAPGAFNQIFLSARMRESGQGVPEVVRILAAGVLEMSLVKEDDYSLRVSALQGTLGAAPGSLDDLKTGGVYSPWYQQQRMDHFFLPSASPWKPGQEVWMSGLRVQVLRTNEQGVPVEALFRFADRLDSPRYQWLCWNQAQLAYEDCVFQ
jgi:hypothetical protein